MAKAISTGLYDLCVYSYRLVLFLLFGNPLSMSLLNLLWPHDTAKFAQNSHIFGEKISAFYERMAMKWPFYWARWWMKLDKLKSYSPRRQVKYLFDIAFPNHTEVEALKAMQGLSLWPDAYDELFYKHGQKCLPLHNRDMKKRLKTPQWYLHNVAVFMMQNVRLSTDALQNVIKWATNDYDMRLALREYLASGKLNNSQFELLLNAVAKDKNGGDKNMLDLLIDYIKRYGLEAQYMVQIQSQYPKDFVKLITEESTLYQQIQKVKSFKNTDEGRHIWRLFCKETAEIPYEVQRLMSIEQYRIFHNVGHKLAPETIKEFLSHSDKMLWKAVFTKEADTCCAGEIRAFIRDNPKLESAYKDALVAQKEE